MAGDRKKENMRGCINSIRSERGIALLMVIWVLIILMTIVLSYSYATRTETNSTLSYKEGIEKKFLAEAGIERGIMEIFYRNVYKNQSINIEGREVWKADNTPYKHQIGSGYYTAAVIDESGKLDINTASDVILKNLLMNSGVSEEDSDAIVDSIMDWKDADDLQRLHGAESDYYMSLPNPYKAKNAPFDTLEELLLVKGMTPEILYGKKEKKGIIDFLTVSSKNSAINLNAAPREVLMAVPGITPEIADGIITYRESKNLAEAGIPPESFKYLNTTESNIFTIVSIGHKGDEKKGYAIKATVIVEGNNKYRYLYYKSPAQISQ